ncbi:hypothetical protein OROMI_030309 [Orobanche minor]
MGNAAPHGVSVAAAGKVILSDGSVFTYDQPLTVAELMLEHPREVVVEFKIVAGGEEPITPLPADQRLEAKKIYVMIPVRKGRPEPLSSDVSRKLLVKTKSLLKSRPILSYEGILPLFVRIRPASHGAVLMDKKKKKKERKKRKEYCLAVDRKAEGREGNKPDYFMEILEGRPQFLSRKISRKGWKPSLDTIRKNVIKAKVRHWMF